MKKDTEKISQKINYFTDDKCLHLSKLKAFADDNFHVDQIIQLFFERVENLVGKVENAGNKHFFPFLTMF